MLTKTNPINAASLPRLQADEAKATASGWVLPPTRFALGTALYGTSTALAAGESDG